MTDPVPQVPPPPVAAVLRPSTWTGPPVPGEVIGDGVPATDPGARVETVSIDTDEDLARFVRALLARVESPSERRDIRAGRLRFTLRHAPDAPDAPDAPAAPAAPAAPHAPAANTPAAAIRIPKGAVTERTIRDAASRGARLVLARGAVLTPLARDQARALGVEIEKEDRC